MPIIYVYLFLLSSGEKFIYSSMPSHVSSLTLNCCVMFPVCVSAKRFGDLEEFKEQSESSMSRKYFCTIVHTESDTVDVARV